MLTRYIVNSQRFFLSVNEVEVLQGLSLLCNWRRKCSQTILVANQQRCYQFHTVLLALLALSGAALATDWDEDSAAQLVGGDEVDVSKAKTLVRKLWRQAKRLLTLYRVLMMWPDQV